MKLGCVNAVRRKDVKQMEQTKCQSAFRAAGSSARAFVCVCVCVRLPVCVCVCGCACMRPEAGDGGVITCTATGGGAGGGNSPAAGLCCCNYLLAKTSSPCLIAPNGLCAPYLGHSLPPPT